MTKTVLHSGVNGSQLRKLRRRERWSQAELADKLAVHRVTLARWESNLVEPPPEAAARMAELFGVGAKSLSSHYFFVSLCLTEPFPAYFVPLKSSLAERGWPVDSPNLRLT